MINWKKIAFGIMAIAIAAFPAAATKALDWNYITLSSYYVLPGQSLNVSGFGFDPNETITVTVPGSVLTATASGAGNFTTSSAVIPFSAVHSNATITARGSSGRTATANLSIGGFYPHVEPSSYYLTQGSTITFFGQHFAPNETVTIRRSNTAVGTATTDVSGNFTSTNFSLPYARGNVTYTFTGENSHAQDTITIKLADWGPVITLNNYYKTAGSNVTVSGQGFGAEEPVSITLNGNTPLAANTTPSGSFALTTPIPSSSSTNGTILATGQLTGATAQTNFTYNLQGSNPAMPLSLNLPTSNPLQ